jgi:hypothetical protein
MQLPTLITKHPLLSFQLAFWFAMEVMMLIVASSTPDFPLNSTIVYSLNGFLTTGLVVFAHERIRAQSTGLKASVLVLVMLIALFVQGNINRISMSEVPIADGLKAPPKDWLIGILRAIWPFALWSICYFSARLAIVHREQKNALIHLQLEAKKAQLMTLRYQLNPHFLFNVLNSIDVSVQSKDNQTAHLMIQQLSRFLRNSLQQGEQDKITLEQEMNIIEDFISIAQLRFGEAIAITVEVDPVCKEAMLPPMLLQPLIENAIKYAWGQSEQGSIKLKVEKDVENLVIDISNGRKNQQQDNKGTGTGLTNISERLKLVYGADASMEISHDELMFSVKLVLPWETSL